MSRPHVIQSRSWESASEPVLVPVPPDGRDCYSMAMLDRPVPTVSSRAADPVIEAYKKGIDRTLIRENLKLTPDERLRRLEAFVRDLERLRAAMTRR